MQNIVNQIKKYNMKTIYTCSSAYHVLLALCMVLLINDIENSCIVMFSPEKKVLEAFYAFSKKMRISGIYNIVINKHTRLYRLLGLSEIENKLIYNQIVKEWGVVNGNFLLVNFSWNQRMVRYPASIYLKRCKEAVFVEEGAAQWITPDEKAWYRFLKRLYGNQENFWRMDKIKSIYVQQPDKFPGYLKSKLLKFKIENCFEKIAENTKAELLEIFLDEKSREELKRVRRLDGIIFTQPISEDGFVSEKEKIKIYREVAEFYSQYGAVGLKIHPRDTTEYQIENAAIIKGTYPSELLMILGIKFKFAIGLCTSAIETANADIKINLNKKFLSEFTYKLYPL